MNTKYYSYYHPIKNKMPAEKWSTSTYNMVSTDFSLLKFLNLSGEIDIFHVHYVPNFLTLGAFFSGTHGKSMVLKSYQRLVKRWCLFQVCRSFPDFFQDLQDFQVSGHHDRQIEEEILITNKYLHLVSLCIYILNHLDCSRIFGTSALRYW